MSTKHQAIMHARHSGPLGVEKYIGRLPSGERVTMTKVHGGIGLRVYFSDDPTDDATFTLLGAQLWYEQGIKESLEYWAYLLYERAYGSYKETVPMPFRAPRKGVSRRQRGMVRITALSQSETHNPSSL